MNRYNVKVIVPILNKTYELFIPNNILVGNFLNMLIKAINDFENLDINNLLLYSASNGEIFNLDEYVYNVINNGMTLVLV